MSNKHLVQAIEIDCYNTDDAHFVAKNRNAAFQIVYVIKGNGFIHMNGNHKPYKAGGLMLLSPTDTYHFEISVPTEFVYIKLNNSFIKEYPRLQMDCLECLLYHASLVSGCVMNNKADMQMVSNIVEALMYERKEGDLYSSDLVMHYVNALIVIAARNIARLKPKELQPNADRRVQDMIAFIQSNIHYPEKLRLLHIAKLYGMSTSYLGRYFKNHCGETIQQFIADYRLRLIEHRLRFSDLRVTEIAGEFGFTDESHLNKFWKKYRQISLTNYRKELKAVMLEIE